MMSSSAEVTHALEVALKKVSDEFKDLPDGNEMTEKITAKFVQTCNSPPIKEFEFLLRKTFTDDEVCMSLFQPREEQIEYFPVMLAIIASLPESHPIKKITPLLVSLVFLVHRKNWEFMKTFISCNGMIVMAEFLDSDNLYLRGQALEIILSGTDCDVFDWFKPPSSYGDKVLHQNLLAFGRSPLTMTKLFANRIGSYPGGSFRALQVIAFVLSWIRALYTADQKLQLSKVAIQNLKDWAQYEGPLPMQNSVTSDLHSDDPELQLAHTLLDDFTGLKNATTDTATTTAPTDTATTTVPTDTATTTVPTDTATNTAPTDTATTTGIKQLLVVGTSEKSASTGDFIVSNLDTSALAGTELPVQSIPSPNLQGVVHTTSDITIEKELSVLDMKEKGNVEFKASQYTAAIEWYHKGLATLELTQKGSEYTLSYADTELAVSLYTNAATSAWKIIQDALIQFPELELQLSEKAEINTKDVKSYDSVGNNKKLVLEFHSTLEQCCMDCIHALQLIPSHTKAAYRLASIYLLQDNSYKAFDVVTTCILANTLRKGENIIPEDDTVESSAGSTDLDMLQQIKRRCLAAILLSSNNKEDRDLGNLGMSTKTIEILSNLLVQYQIELDLPAISSSSGTNTSLSAATGKLFNMQNMIKSTAGTSDTTSAGNTTGGVTSTGTTTTTTTTGARTTRNLIKEKRTTKKGTDSSYNKVSTPENTTEKTKTKMKKKKASSGTTTAATSGTSSIAQRLQQIDDELLDALMKKGSVKD